MPGTTGVLRSRWNQCEVQVQGLVHHRVSRGGQSHNALSEMRVHQHRVSRPGREADASDFVMYHRVGFVYALEDSRDGTYHYVGMSRDPVENWGISHKKPVGKTPKDRWVGELNTLGLLPRLVILEATFLPRQREVVWIAHGRAVGWPLSNVNGGGNGPTGCSLATRELLRVRSTGRHLTGESRDKIRVARLGTTHSVFSRLKMSRVRQGRRDSFGTVHRKRLAQLRRYRFGKGGDKTWL